MVHRSSPANAAFRGYVAGGARHCVDQVDDNPLMQTSGGNFMANESRKNMEAPQNYGFTSVVHPKDDSGSAEAFVQFMGGNRSLPIANSMDDRRHRLNKLDQGDTAMFRGKSDYQQFHMANEGGFWSGPQDKTLRMALVQKNSGQQQQQGGGSGGGGGQPGQRAAGGGNGGGTGGGQQSPQKTGQQNLKQDNQKSPYFVDITQNKTRLSGKEAHLMLDDGETYTHCVGGNMYCGTEKDKHPAAIVVTVKGPCKNVWGRIG
jgi:hypothetical protein